MVSQEPVPHDRPISSDRADPEVARETLESLYPDAETRAGLLSLFADSMETAHGVNPAAWSVTLGLGGRRVNLNAGKIYAVSLRADRVGVSLRFRPDELTAPWADEVRESVREAFRAVPGVHWCGFPPDRLLELWEDLRPLHVAAVEESAGGVRRTPYYRSHSPGVLQYVARVVGRSLPPPEHGGDDAAGGLTERILSLLRRRFPDFDSVEHPGFTEEEITYKREAAALAEELLGESHLRELMEEGRFDDVVARVKKVAQKTNLLYLGAPSSGDLAALHADGLDREAFSHALVDLLYGDGDSPERLQRFTEFLESRELPNKWTLPTYLLFLRFPETEYFVKPSVTRWFLKQAGVADLYDPRPDGETYGRILEHVRDLAAELAPFGVRDLIDVQSALWVAHAHAREEQDIHPGEAKLQEMDSLFAEFVRDYLTDPAGREHMSRYDEVREAGRRSYQEIVAARDAGEDVTDRVLRELLPHTDSEAHRDDGAWIHVAPAIRGTVKSFFEAAGWRQPGDWEEVARAVLDFAERCHREPSELERACVKFSKQPWSTGLQTGMLTPILNALRPDDFLLLNDRSRQLINYLSGRSLSQKLVDYPDLNRIGQILIEILSDQLDSAPTEARTADVFDAFGHWLVSIRRFSFGKPQYWKIAPGEGAEYWDDSLEGGFISMGWNDLGDLSNVSREGFEERRDRSIETDDSQTKEALEQLWKFAKEIREGDRIVANQGTRRVLGFGMVTGPYHYVPDADHSHRLPVDWDNTTPRRVREGGWRRALVSLDRDHYRRLLDVPDLNGDTEGLGSKAFELLARLENEPTNERYQEHKTAFKSHLEGPFQELMAQVVSRLPTKITEKLETERNIFGRIPKNDYGRGGGWPFYWGALYPEGSRRIEAPQLFLAIKHGRLEAGFSIGEYSSGVGQRFVTNVRRLGEQLPKMLEANLAGDDLEFGSRDSKGAEAESPQAERVPRRRWLEDPAEFGIEVTRTFPEREVIDTPTEELADGIAQVFQRLFPLVLLCLDDDPLDLLGDYLGEVVDPLPDQTNPPYPLEECATGLHLPLPELQRWVRAIERKGQAILYGPPGTGKTHVAEHLARHLIGGADGFTELVQFHPSFSYEDFIQGLRPEALADGGLSYPVKRGRFLDFCAEARRREGTCVLIVDEINRANLSRVFGELMYLLEYREESVRLAADGRSFSIPGNVRILGTMNTADRSIALVDHALRRRFAFLALRPSYDTLRRHHEGRGEEVRDLVEPLITLLKEVNGAIGDPHYELGITYFLVDDLPELLEDVWRMEVEPYLEEYFYDQPGTTERFRWSAVRGRLSP